MFPYRTMQARPHRQECSDRSTRGRKPLSRAMGPVGGYPGTRPAGRDRFATAEPGMFEESRVPVNLRPASQRNGELHEQFNDGIVDQ